MCRSGLHPYGLVSLASPAVKPAQEYDISVSLSMPPSAPNVERGNFMVALHLLDQDVTPSLQSAARTFANTHDGFEGHNVVFSSRRPTLLPYVDPIVSLASRVFFLFYYMLFPSSQTCDMKVYLAERVIFPRGAALPSAAYIEVEAGQDLQTYQVWLTLTAQLRGLRWLMHHYRLPTYIACTLVFWISEVLFMAVAWTVLVSAAGGPREDGRLGIDGKGGTKTRLLAAEAEDELSDHPHSFPTYGKQPPLKHEPKVKDEQHERLLSEIPVGGAEADDEDDYDDEPRSQVHDSGIGTSYSEEGSHQIRRRTSRHER
jgi:hypothetical protein